MAEATNHADTYHRHGDPDPSKWDEADAVTGREADPVPTNTSFADRAKAGTAENKQVQSAEAKSLDDMTKDELYAMATDRDIEGRSSMSKPQLIKALNR